MELIGRSAAPDSRPVEVRTMGCIRLEKMTEYLIDPLRRRA